MKATLDTHDGELDDISVFEYSRDTSTSQIEITDSQSDSESSIDKQA
jgi:hypothetical protein